MFYVYQYLREDGTPYYIGKGKDRRAWDKHPNIRLPKNKSNIIIISDNLTESQAFDLEKELIAKYGRKNNNTGILRNKTDGGEGVSGKIVTKEMRQHLSILNKGKTISLETREKLRIANIGKKLSKEHVEIIKQVNTGKILTDETKQKMSASKKGLELSNNHKKNISESLKGKPWSEARRLAQKNRIKSQ